MTGNRAARRAWERGVTRTDSSLPLFEDETLLVTPEVAQELLKKNKKNRPVNWNKVEEYAEIMRRGEWKLHAQGIILDELGNIVTGQKRLWAVVYADTPVYFRVTRGNPSDTAPVIDRGQAQSARDLATRVTGRRHSPVEASIVRAALVASGNRSPTKDQISSKTVASDSSLAMMLDRTRGTKKTRSMLMALGAIIHVAGGDFEKASALTYLSGEIASKLEEKLSPRTARACWGRGLAFELAMKLAVDAVRELGESR